MRAVKSTKETEGMRAAHVSICCTIDTEYQIACTTILLYVPPLRMRAVKSTKEIEGMRAAHVSTCCTIDTEH